MGDYGWSSLRQLFPVYLWGFELNDISGQLFLLFRLIDGRYFPFDYPRKAILGIELLFVFEEGLSLKLYYFLFLVDLLLYAMTTIIVLVL